MKKKSEYVELEGGGVANEEKAGGASPVKKNESKNDSEREAPKELKKIRATKGIPVKRDRGVKDIVETDVDKLYELVRDKGIVKLNEASKAFKIDSEVIEEWGRILEEHKLVRLRYPPVGEPVLILKRFTSDTEEIKGLKGKKLKPKRRVFIINFIILACFIGFVAFYTIKIPTVRITYFQAYLAVALIIIIGIVLIWRMKRRRKNASQSKT